MFFCGIPIPHWCIAEESLKKELDFGYNFFYTIFMKTAISIPDALFKSAEKTAKTIGISRSRLFTMAIEAFLSHRNSSQVTEALNRIYPDSADGLDAQISRMQTESLPGETW